MVDNTKLIALWKKGEEYVQCGGVMYRVFTPNGDDDPVFVPCNSADAYSTTSTGFVRMSDPAEPVKAKPKPGARRQMPGPTKNQELTDVK